MRHEIFCVLKIGRAYRKENYYPKATFFPFVCPFTKKEVFGGIMSVSHHIAKTQDYFIYDGMIELNDEVKPIK